jgi:DNA-directed RNA polymerase I, II, and III subunit RPABC2
METVAMNKKETKQENTQVENTQVENTQVENTQVENTQVENTQVENKQKVKVENETYNETKEIEKNDKTIELFGEIDNYNEYGIVLSDDDEEDEIINIENNIEYNLLNKFHPEMKQINNNELNSLIIQDKNKKGYDNNHTTIPIMTRYEKAKIIGLRASQINAGSDILIDIPDNIIDGITIAKMELEQKKIPFIIRRPLPNGKSEYWDINDLEILE